MPPVRTQRKRSTFLGLRCLGLQSSGIQKLYLETRLTRLIKPLGALLSLGLLFTSVASIASEKEQALQMHSRLTGTLPSEATLISMAQDIGNGNALDAATTAMNDEAFYAVTLKNLAAPWTNRDQDVFAPFNDYIATFIGIVRDDIDFRDILSANTLYIGKASLGLPPYSASNNNHYESFESSSASYKNDLTFATQSSFNGIPATATAGILTSRAAAKAFFVDGTNRAMFRFTLFNHLCRDLEQVHDITLSPDRIRQDVSRSPGGDSRVFQNNCIGCHTGMDPLTQAFAYYDFVYDVDTDPNADNGRIDYNQGNDIDPVTGTRVKAKYHNNSATFPQGYVTPNDNWDNYWRAGPNLHLGWSNALPGSGSGAKSMGTELANSRAFAECQTSKIFENICLRKPENSADRTQIQTITNNFISSGYKLKQVFAESAVYCAGN